MTSGKTDSPIQRYIIHAIMIFLVLLAITPVYVLLINATRTTEQINRGLTIIPGSDAFISKTEELSRITRTQDGEAGTVKYQDIIQGITFVNEGNEKRIVYPVPEDRSPQILIVDDDGSTIANYFLSSGDYILVYDGEKIRPNNPVYKTFTYTADTSGRIRYVDINSNTTLIEEQDKNGNLSKRIDEYYPVSPNATTRNLRPSLTIINDEGAIISSFNIPSGSYLEVNNGDRVQEGKILVKSVRRPVNIKYNWNALTCRGFQIWQGFSNSAIIAICSTALVVYFSALTAYGLHVYRFRGRLAIWAIILVIMMLPGSLTFIGFYQLMATWRLTDSFIPLILPGIAAAGAVLFIRQYMMSVLSLELIDAARIDGASEYRIFNVIILPITIPALAAQAIFAFVGSWNNFLTPTVLITSQSKYTLPMLVNMLRGDIYRTEYGGIYLGIAISLVPIIIFYSFMSRFIISGLTLGGVKE